MSWDTIKTQLESLKASLATQLSATSLETAESAKTADVTGIKAACDGIVGQAQDIQRLVEDKREPTAEEALEAKLDAIRADKEHKEVLVRDKDGYIDTVTFSSEKVATKIVQTWHWRVENDRHHMNGTTLAEVAK
jgi:hypothetical protein